VSLRLTHNNSARFKASKILLIAITHVHSFNSVSGWRVNGLMSLYTDSRNAPASPGRCNSLQHVNYRSALGESQR